MDEPTTPKFPRTLFQMLMLEAAEMVVFTAKSLKYSQLDTLEFVISAWQRIEPTDRMVFGALVVSGNATRLGGIVDQISTEFPIQRAADVLARLREAVVKESQPMDEYTAAQLEVLRGKTQA